MAAIVDSLLDGNRRLQIGNEEFVRGLSFGSNWTKVRIGIRFTVNDTGGGNISSPANFFVGLCEGTTNTFFSNNTTGFIGCNNSTGLNNAWSYNASYYTACYNSCIIAKRVGNTTSSLGSYGLQYIGSDRWFFVGKAPNIGYAFWDFTKNSTSIVFNLFWSFSTGYYGITLSNFIWGLDNETAPPYLANWGSPNTVAYGNSIGNLDTLSISWSKSTPTIELCDVAVIRFA